MARALTRYTVEELLALRDSPLAKRPDGLPSIEQWIESVSTRLIQNSKPKADQNSAPAEQNGQRRKPQGSRVEDQYSALDNGEQRPRLHARQSTKTPGSGVYFQVAIEVTLLVWNMQLMADR